MNNFIKMPEKNITVKLHNKIEQLINQYFKKLNTLHKKMLIKYLYQTVLFAYYYFYDENFMEQMFMNNYQDIFSFLVLLLPYFELNMCENIISLDELFLNSDSKSKSISSSYYIDHQKLKNNQNYLVHYFNSSVFFIENTFKNVHCLLIPNWINIFPYTMDDYKNSPEYKNCKKKFVEKNFPQDANILVLNDDIDKSMEDAFKLGYPIFYGIIHGFMYNEIKPIKWMIYDINIENKIILPNIVYLTDKLKLESVVNVPWVKLSEYDKKEKNILWKKFYESKDTNQNSLKSIVLFYLRWEKENDNLTELNFPPNCLKIIKTNIENIDNILINDNNLDDLDENKIFYNMDDEIEKCLIQIYSHVKFEKIYNFIYESAQRFKYTWYGYVCMDDNKNLLNVNDYFKNYFNKYPSLKKFNDNVDIKNKPNNDLDNEMEKVNEKYYYPTPKNFYNFCKALIHVNLDDKYVLMSSSPTWNNVDAFYQIKFISRLNNNDDDDLDNWFNIKKNISRTYQLDRKTEQEKINFIMNKLKNFFLFEGTFINVIFETMVYNGIFTYFKYNPKLTDNTILPDKNKNHPEWKKYILNTVDINLYANSYHPFSNTTLKTKINLNPNDTIDTIDTINTIDTIKKSLWYTNFGANWIAQIQLYHHFINNRVLYITGATGAGKSTVAPFLLVYAVKIINFKNDAKVVCTQPRTQPTKDNAERIAFSIGYPIIMKNDNSMDNIDEAYRKTSLKEGVPQNINYIQYKHKKGTLIDDLYHPYLRLYTDGSLYNIINRNYMFKKSIKSYSDPIPKFISANLFDVILVDEAHEHNTNMDLILTLSKFATYINNQITLGIISATMDNDELIYRKYYEPIDDNWKFPLKFDMIDVYFDRYVIDKRIHLSIPFGGMNFEVKEYPSKEINYPKSAETFTDMKKINQEVIKVLKHILNTTPNRLNSDILIFQPGESDIRKLLKEINEQTPPNVIAIPFYSKLNTEILESYVKKIDVPEVRKKIRYPKNEYDISQINEVPKDKLLPEGTYTRFVILATNIAEASITINTFEYVIETGNQKINIYDYDTNQSKLLTIPIAIPNYKQRKGRVGRIKPGNVFYLYDRFELSEKVGYKLNTENISSFVFDLVTSTNEQIINKDNDPYKNSNFQNYPEFLKSQYMIITNSKYNSYYDYFKQTDMYYSNIKSFITNKIVYPHSDGKYELKTLEDENGEFYIIHPNEDYFERDPITLNIISKNAKPNYFNKVKKVFDYGKATGMVGDNNLLTQYGILVNNLSDFMEFAENSIDYTKIILDAFSFGLDKEPDIFKNILMFMVFKSSGISLKLPNYSVGKSDYLLMMKQIDSSLFEMFDLNDIFDSINADFNNFNDVVKNKVNTLLFKKNFDSNTNLITKNIDGIKQILIAFYQIKLRIDIVKLNSKYILKKEFEPMLNSLISLIDETKKNKLNNDYIKLQTVINKITIYYTNEEQFLKKNVILRLINEIKTISENNIDDKKTLRHIINKTNKITKFINDTSLFENENLISINIYDNKKYSNKIINLFNKLNEYDKMCFVLAKNLTQNVLVKITHTEFYINYFNMNINNIYSLETIFDKYVKTKVPSDIRNFYIFIIDANDSNGLNNIMVLSGDLINGLNQYFNELGINLKKKNMIFDKERAMSKYQDKYTDILKKIDKIIEYMNSAN